MKRLLNILRKKKIVALVYELYEGCRDLPLEGFINYIITHKAGHLCRFGAAPDEVASERWDVIYSEYCCLVGLQSYQELLTAYKELARLKNSQMIISTALIVLHLRPSDICSQSLNDLGYFFEEGLDRDKHLALVEKRAKNLSILIKIRNKEIENLSKGNKKAVNESDLRKGVTAISKYMGIRVDPLQVTLYEYAMMQRMMSEEIQRTRQKENGRTD